MLGLIGISAELWLMGHHEDWYQLIPLVLGGVAVASLAVMLSATTATTVNAKRQIITICLRMLFAPP